MKESTVIKIHKFELNGQVIVFRELEDGTFNPNTTPNIYTREQFEAGVEKIKARGGKSID